MESGSRLGYKVVCLNNFGAADFLKIESVYQTLINPDARKVGCLEVIDETGKPNFYKCDRFIVDLWGNTVMDVTGEQFDETVIKSQIPVLVDFYTPQCGPCKIMAPVVEQVAKELDGKVLVVKVNVAAEFEIGTRFKISAVPMFALFKAGQMVDRLVGSQSKEQLLGFALQ